MPSDTPSERVEQARANVYLDRTMSTDADVDALVAAVRAEERARVRGMVEGMHLGTDATIARARVLELLSEREGALALRSLAVRIESLLSDKET